MGIISLQPAPGDLELGWPFVFLEFGLVLMFAPPPMSCGMWAAPGRGMTLGEGLSSAEGQSQEVRQGGLSGSSRPRA